MLNNSGYQDREAGQGAAVLMRHAQVTAMTLVAPGFGRRLAVLGVFLSLGLAAGSSALTLGDLQVQSTLGEPLSALVRVGAGAQETIRRECFSAGAETGAVEGIPSVGNLVLVLERRAGGTHLRMLSRAPVREPMAQVVLRVRCPGLPNLTRSYIVLLDPASMFQATTTLGNRELAAAATGSAELIRGNIPPGSRYTVQPGDTLSGIAARIDGRPPYSVWPLASRIRALNPEAFENGQADALIAGSRLSIPTLDALAAGVRRPAAGTATRQYVAPRPQADSGPATTPVDSPATPTPVSHADAEVADGYPVLVAEPVDAPRLEYFVITARLSPLSISRIRQRVEQAAIEAPVQPEPAVAVVSAPAPVEKQTAWYSIWWYWALALMLLTLGALAAVKVSERRRETAIDGEDESPWELGEEIDAPVPELEQPAQKVYDDFAGTFVAPAPEAETIPLPASDKDPEEEIQTHLMPALTDLPQKDQPAEESPPPRAPTAGARRQEINVTEIDDEEADADEHGWLELDFEATQILEQDYLAEYAASLKTKIREQSEALEEDSENPEADDSVLAASELIRALDEDLISTEALELMEDDNPTKELATPEETMVADESETSEMPTVELSDDNIVTLGNAKKNTAKDGDEADGRLKGSKKS